MTKGFRLVVLLSGRGSNFRRLFQACNGYEIVLVLSDKADAGGLEFARSVGIPCQAFPRQSYESIDRQKDAIYAAALSASPDLVALAGYMQIVRPDFVRNLSGRIVNIHPALLPKFPGLHTHARALAAKESEHGCTVHFVDEGVDTGPIIAQARVAVQPTDTEESLAARVLEREHQLYPWVVSHIARGGITLKDRSVGYDAETLASAKSLGFSKPADNAG